MQKIKNIVKLETIIIQVNTENLYIYEIQNIVCLNKLSEFFTMDLTMIIIS